MSIKCKSIPKSFNNQHITYFNDVFLCTMHHNIPLTERIDSFHLLGQRLSNLNLLEKEAIYQEAIHENNWFIPESIDKAIKELESVLHRKNLEKWIAPYTLTPITSKVVGLILAGNIPLVGFHDLLSVLISGHRAKVKLSSQDSTLIKFVIKALVKIAPTWNEKVEITEGFKNIDAVIATGSDNSSRYFKHYFSKYPRIIRQNRTSVAIIRGNESKGSLHLLGNDIFQYFGLGCRNVSKIYIPKGYDMKVLAEAMAPFESILGHHKYHNNYDYNKSVYLVNKEPHLDSGFCLFRESDQLVSPIAVIFYEEYENEIALTSIISPNRHKIQCIVSENGWYEDSTPFGQAQQPALWDYADGVDTLEFLDKL